MAAKLILLAVETWNGSTGVTGAVKVADILDFRTYTNELNETVSLIETPSGMLPAIAITQSYSSNVGSLPAPADDLAAPLAVVLALGHLAGLLPWFADGRHLWAGGSR